MHVQGGGDNAQQAGGEPRASVDGAFSLVANTLKLSTVQVLFIEKIFHFILHIVSSCT